MEDGPSFPFYRNGTSLKLDNCGEINPSGVTPTMWKGGERVGCTALTWFHHFSKPSEQPCQQHIPIPNSQRRKLELRKLKGFIRAVQLIQICRLVTWSPNPALFPPRSKN